MRAGSIPYEGIKFYSYAKFKEWLPHNRDGSQVMGLACECRVTTCSRRVSGSHDCPLPKEGRWRT